MSVAPTLSDTAMRAPRAAAIAGIAFSVLSFVSVALFRLAIPADPHDPGGWLADSTLRGWVQIAINLVPFAGIAFLWFMAVLRNRVGLLEDRFFSTVFIGSGLLFVALLFGTAAIARGLLDVFGLGGAPAAQNEAYAVGRATIYALVNTFAARMAAVFMFVTSTIGQRTRIFPRWLSLVGFALGLVLLLAVTDFTWIVLLFPLWVLLVSGYILLEDLREQRLVATGGANG